MIIGRSKAERISRFRFLRQAMFGHIKRNFTFDIFWNDFQSEFKELKWPRSIELFPRRKSIPFDPSFRRITRFPLLIVTIESYH